MSAITDSFHVKRRFPRRRFERQISVLCGGQYFTCEAQEIGEGGMALGSEFLISEGKELIVNFQIPGADFYSVRAIVKNNFGKKLQNDGKIRLGISFKEVSFVMKRQIRTFVSSAR